MEETQIPPQVSVLVVSYGRPAVLRRCLAALEQSAGRETFEIIVVDNGSLDDTAAVIEEFPSVTPLRLPRNFGFTRALNIAMRTAKAELFLFLNPRTEVLPGTVQLLSATVAAEADAVAACPLLLDSSGEPAPLLYRLPSPDRLSALAGAGQFDAAPETDAAAGTQKVEFASFAALMVRGYFLKGLRYIDEHYAQSWADAEVAAQIRRAGKKTLLVPGARAIWHAEDGLRELLPPAALAVLASDWVMGASSFASKHFGFAAGLKVRIAATLRALFTFRLREFFNLVSGQKIDGTQTAL